MVYDSFVLDKRDDYVAYATFKLGSLDDAREVVNEACFKLYLRWDEALASENTAAYALFLEGLLRDEPVEAVYCYRSLDASGFLCDEDWDTSPARISAAEPALRAEVDEHLQEVTGPAGAELASNESSGPRGTLGF
ncbi:hypothetical protein AB0D12_40110 [Streptomyces sp. NPDC048479]|uniref:hypothetical protein n=1 Tax=Streptomyces sp. NPDC048479 TaxID=3154725 RepID=UPI0034444CD6